MLDFGVGVAVRMHMAGNTDSSTPAYSNIGL